MKLYKHTANILYALATINLIIIIWICTLPYDVKSTAVIQTTSGSIQGIKESGISVFKGVPYAAAPVGLMRFKAPKPCQSWKGILKTISFAPQAAQISDFTQGPSGSENALFLNIYTPLIKGKKLPVLFWIHGGAMVTGSGSPYNGHAFADNDSIVVVNINYRLGILGFTYLDDLGNDYRGSGNNGLLDCVAALQWVRQNIAAFGGDPEKITVAGQSAGAKLACALMAVPQARGLFNQVISESGGLQSVRSINTAKATRSNLLKLLHLKNNEAGRLLTLPADTLLKAQQAVANGTAGLAFLGPVIDDVAIKEDPYQYIKEGKTSVKAALIGNNATEITSFFLANKRLKKPNAAIFNSLFGENASYVINNYQQRLKKQDTEAAAIDVLSQYLYIMHSFRLANALGTGAVPVYLYRFNYAKGIAGAGHGTELPFVWYHPLNANQPVRDQLFEIARRLLKGADPLALQMHQAWVQFIKRGDPNNEHNANWKPFTSESRTVMFLDMPRSFPVKLDSVFNDKSFPGSGFILNSKAFRQRFN
jgi:para-nitrobenzyl esterase